MPLFFQPFDKALKVFAGFLHQQLNFAHLKTSLTSLQTGAIVLEIAAENPV
jgi:hypothetical protein